MPTGKQTADLPSAMVTFWSGFESEHPVAYSADSDITPACQDGSQLFCHSLYRPKLVRAAAQRSTSHHIWL